MAETPPAPLYRSVDEAFNAGIDKCIAKLEETGFLGAEHFLGCLRTGAPPTDAHAKKKLRWLEPGEDATTEIRAWLNDPTAEGPYQLYPKHAYALLEVIDKPRDVIGFGHIKHPVSGNCVFCGALVESAALACSARDQKTGELIDVPTGFRPKDALDRANEIWNDSGCKTLDRVAWVTSLLIDYLMAERGDKP